MWVHDATEQAYKNGYEKGYADALAFAINELKPIAELLKECAQKSKKLKDFATNIMPLPEPPDLSTGGQNG